MPEKCVDVCPQLDKLEREVDYLRKHNTEEHKEIFTRLNAVEKMNAVQNEQYSNTMEKLDEISEKQDALGAKISALEMKPGKRWDKMVETILVAVVTAVVAYLLGRSGL